MPYVSFISDDDLLECIGNLYKTYERCKRDTTIDSFYSNKVDPIKFQFDMAFNDIEPDAYIKAEINRQNDKTISNAIGVFQQSLLGCIDGINDLGVGNQCDISNESGTIFAEVKNKHNTMNSSSSEATFQKLARIADEHPNATCYLVQVIAKGSFDKLWEVRFGDRSYSHPRVRIISGDKFYGLLTGVPDAFYQLCEAIPIATHDFIEGLLQEDKEEATSSVYEQLVVAAEKNNITLLEQIMTDNFSSYEGFER